MIELKGTWERAYYVFQVSPEQILTLVPYGPYNPAAVVQQSLLAKAGFPTRGTTGNGWGSGFYVETWSVR